MNKALHPLVGLFALASLATVARAIPSDAKPTTIVSTAAEPVAPGKFAPTWKSLQQYQVPEWFRDAKFGIWGHWSPQCQGEGGDWYGRFIYLQGHPQYERHLKQYGHPSVTGFKDVIHEWQGEHWDPEKLMALYKRAGARYFFALANHHDNFDNWDSKYQPWNAVNMGPKKDLIAGWAAAARKEGLKFGVSVHASHAWSWYEPAQGADLTGPLAGAPYDGKLTKADGKGTWWDGYDPQDLYEQRHTPSPHYQELKSIWTRWQWGDGVSQPDQAYCERFYNRTIDLINKYQPDLLYFDDTALPLWPVSDAGLKIAAHFYNRSEQRHGDDGVVFGKILEADQRQCLIWDVERGRSNVMEPVPWQAETCLGDWFYDRSVFDRHGYKSARLIVHTLIDVVSKNGNFLLSVPLRGDGTPDSDEIAIVEGIASWMQINQEAIHGTRPWKIFGEGPQASTIAPLQGPGMNETMTSPFTAADVRFTTKGSTLYAIVTGAPKTAVAIKSLGTAAKLLDAPIASITLLGSDEKLNWSQTAEALTIETPRHVPNDIAVVFKITPRS